MTITQLNYCFSVIDNFLCRTDQRYDNNIGGYVSSTNIIDPSYSKLPDFVRAKIKQDHKDIISINELYNKYGHTHAIPVHSKDLFEKVNTSEKYFKKTESGWEWVQKKDYRSNKRKKLIFPCSVITIRRGEGYKYLIYKDQVCGEFIQIPKFSRIVLPGVNNTAYNELLNINALRLTDEDTRLLLSFITNKGSCNHRSKEVFDRWYALVESEYNAYMFTKTFNRKHRRFPPKYTSPTRKIYAYSNSLMLFIFDNINKFELFASNEFANVKKHINLLYTAADTDRYANITHYMLTNNEACPLLIVILKLYVFCWVGYDPMKLKTTQNYRRVMDALKASFIYSMIYRLISKKLTHMSGGIHIFFNDKSDGYSFFRKCYTAISEINVGHGQRSRPYPPDGYVINGFVLTRKYVRSFYTDMMDVIMKDLEQFKPYFKNIPAVETIRDRFICDPEINLTEARCGTTCSLLDYSRIN